MSKYLFLVFSIIGFGILLRYLSNVSSNEKILELPPTDFSVNDSVETAVPSPISIDYLRTLQISGSEPVLVETLAEGSNYSRSIYSYKSQDLTIYGLLTIPKGPAPEGGFPAIVFNHGYIPPSQYKTTEKYISYVDSLAKSGFVVFKIDMRGHGESEGTAGGSYFSNGYTIDALSALKSLQMLDFINPERIGMWGHSMSGNLVLRTMLVSSEVKASVIWAGAVYSYEDFAKYRLNDSSYIRRPDPFPTVNIPGRDESSEIRKIRENPQEINLQSDYWRSVSLTSNLQYLSAPIQLHHAVDDNVVNIGYSRDLASKLKDEEKTYEIYEYPSGGHNINSPYFEQAIQRTIEFYKKYL